MVNLPPEFVLNSTLAVGTIYKFEAPELINTSNPHHFIVVGIDGSDNYLVLCTSQKEKKEKYFDNNDLDYTSLVYIKPDPSNGLTTETFVNCNDYYSVSKTSLTNKIRDNTLSYTGKVSINHYSQIKLGIAKSFTNDLPIDLLVHPEE